MVRILLWVANTWSSGSKQDRLGSSDQGDSGAPPGGGAEALPPGIGDVEKWSSRPGLFQLALDVPGVGEEAEADAVAC